MELINAVHPTADQLKLLLGRANPDAPVSMLNLLKFKDKAVYADGRETDLTGLEAYMLYGSAMKKLVEAGGGKLKFSGIMEAMIVGQGDAKWDSCGIMQYPSSQAFLDMVMSPEVAAIGVHREAGLEGQVLYAMTEAPE